jgi:hypothetical protein
MLQIIKEYQISEWVYRFQMNKKKIVNIIQIMLEYYNYDVMFILNFT